MNRLSAVGSHDIRGAEQVRAEVGVWTELLKQLGRLLTDMGRMDVDLRLRRQAQDDQLGERAAVAVDWLLRALGLEHDPRAQDLARQMVAAMLSDGPPAPPPLALPMRLTVDPELGQ